MRELLINGRDWRRPAFYESRLPTRSGPVSVIAPNDCSSASAAIPPRVVPPGMVRKAFHLDYPTFANENNLSMAVHVTLHGIGFLFPGDLETAGWLALLAKDAGFRMPDSQATVPWYRSKVQPKYLPFRGESRHVLTTRRDGTINFHCEAGSWHGY